MLTKEQNEELIDALTSFLDKTKEECCEDVYNEVNSLISDKIKKHKDRVYYWTYQIDYQDEYDAQFNSYNEAYDAVQDFLMERQAPTIGNGSYREDVQIIGYIIDDAEPIEISRVNETISFDAGDYGIDAETEYKLNVYGRL